MEENNDKESVICVNCGGSIFIFNGKTGLLRHSCVQCGSENFRILNRKPPPPPIQKFGGVSCSYCRTNIIPEDRNRLASDPLTEEEKATVRKHVEHCPESPVGDLRNRLERAELRASELTCAHRNVIKHSDELMKEKKDLEDRNTTLVCTLEEEKGRFVKLQEEVKELKREVEYNKGLTDRQDLRISYLNRTNLGLSTDNQSLRKQVEELKNSNESLLQQVAHRVGLQDSFLVRDNARLKEENAKLKAYQAEQEAHTKAVVKHRSYVMDERDRLVEENGALRKELAKLKGAGAVTEIQWGDKKIEVRDSKSLADKNEELLKELNKVNAKLFRANARLRDIHNALSRDLS